MGGVGEEALNSCVATWREGRPLHSVFCTLEKGQVQHPTLLTLFFFFKFNLEASPDCQQNPCHSFPGRYKNASGPRAEMAHSELRSASAQLADRETAGLGESAPQDRERNW